MILKATASQQNQCRDFLRSRTRRTLFLGTVGVALLSCVGILILLFHGTTPPTFNINLNDAERLKESLKVAERAASSTGTPQPAKVDQSELNAILTERLRPSSHATAAGEDLAVRDVRVWLIDDRMIVHFLIAYKGGNTTLDFDARVSAADGYLNIKPAGGKIGSVPIPKWTLEATLKQLQDSPQSRNLFRLPANLTGFSISGGQMQLTVSK